METHRFGNFSSSSIYKLMGNGKIAGQLSAPALTYIKHKNRERKAGRAYSTEQGSRATEWGNFVEQSCFELLSTNYRLVSKERITHPYIPYYNGCPDLLSDNCVSDVKCPFSLTSFFDLIECLEDSLTSNPELGPNMSMFKKEYPDFYWQLISNSVLAKTKFAELIVYMPYQQELDVIRRMVNEYPGGEKVQWIKYAEDKELPYLIEGMAYKNINKFRFEAPEADKIALIDKIKEAGKLLIDPFTAKQIAA